MTEQKLRIILVHGACHGAWCWHKVVEALRSEGHSAAALDLAASGLDPRRIPEDVTTLEEYSQPLMETVAALPAGEKAVLVGHSLGGLSLALAMETFPGKITVAVFVTAFMPDTTHPPAYVFDKFAEHTPASKWKDTEFKEVRVHGRDEPFTTMLFGPRFMAENIYQLCSPQDLALAKSMVRIGSLFKEDLKMRGSVLSEEGYGSVDKVYIVCGEDASITEDYQRWVIRNNMVKQVIVIEEADHTVMLSRPQELCRHLTDIVHAYA